VIIKAYPFHLDILDGTTLLARHLRSYAREQDLFEPLHYLPLLEQRPGAFDYVRPMRQWRKDWPESYHQMLRVLRAHGLRNEVVAEMRSFVWQAFVSAKQAETKACLRKAASLFYLCSDQMLRLISILCRQAACVSCILGVLCSPYARCASNWLTMCLLPSMRLMAAGRPGRWVNSQWTAWIKRSINSILSLLQ
jgi:hypothetical protein